MRCDTIESSTWKVEEHCPSKVEHIKSIRDSQDRLERTTETCSLLPSCSVSAVSNEGIVHAVKTNISKQLQVPDKNG